MATSTLVAAAVILLALLQSILLLRLAQRSPTNTGEWVVHVASNILSLLILGSISEGTSPAFTRLLRWKPNAADGPPYHSASLSYRPLQQGEIRLLKFSDEHGTKEDALRFDLFHIKLEQRPHYVALSYSWGDAEAQGRRSIIVNGQKYEVSTNLADALLKLKEHNISTVWVDAISINQQDNVEKSREVIRMFTIYGTAALVVVWLGNNTGPEKDMIELSMSITQVEKPTSKLNHNNATSLGPAALQRLLSQPYWQRVWIIQEVAAAKQVQIFWGSYIFDLRSLETLIRDLPTLNDPDYRSHSLAHKVISVRASCRGRQKLKLMDILATTASSRTSVVRDKVYGLLGLASDWTDFISEPHYLQDISENNLCLQMTTKHIDWYNSADIIFLRSIKLHQGELPSWCPDYFHFQPHESDANLISYICGKNPNLGWERRRAFGQDSPTMNEIVPDTFISSGNRLTLRGRVIGRVRALGSVTENEMAVPVQRDLVRGDDAIGKSFRRLLLICHNQTLGHQPSSAFFSLLYTLPKQIFRERGLTNVKRWLDSHRLFLEAFGVTLRPGSDEYAFITRRGGGGGFSPSSKVLPEWGEFFSLNADSTISRRGQHPLFSMLQSMSSILDEHMRLMDIHEDVLLGWAHRDAMPGDTVWHLEGCTLQAILRKSETLSREHGESIYRLIGHAYVDPVMASGRWMAKETGSRLVHLR